jgi:prepilin signal peptidase PulO-like enzyme (type II secretory pathway)
MASEILDNPADFPSSSPVRPLHLIGLGFLFWLFLAELSGTARLLIADILLISDAPPLWTATLPDVLALLIFAIAAGFHIRRFRHQLAKKVGFHWFFYRLLLPIILLVGFQFIYTFFRVDLLPHSYLDQLQQFHAYRSHHAFTSLLVEMRHIIQYCLLGLLLFR